MKRRYRWRININGFHKKDLDSATFRGWPHIDSRDEEKWEEYTCLTKMKLHLIFVLIFFGAVAGAGERESFRRGINLHRIFATRAL